ncbi:MAG: TIGR00282 family metallophosphoesterase [Chloroflexi bacterium]|nr:TIGR00282 family metallophosphoesterase [Chloroflexota bacterium]
MRVLMVGDVVGQPGRKAVRKLLPKLKQELAPDLVIANGENSANGLGMTPETVQELYDSGVDVITSGNHAWDKREIVPYLESELPLIRPLNYPPGVPGHGYTFCKGALIVNVLGRVFLPSVDDPFRALNNLLDEEGHRTKVVIVDAHTEATSEIGALGWYFDGRVSAILGTHTHVATADARVLPKGTAFVSDVGMVGPRGSIIGNVPEDVLKRFATQLYSPLGVADGPVTFSSVLVEIEARTGKAKSIQRVDREVA